MDNLNHVKWRTVGCMQAICTNPPSRRLPAGLPSYYPGPEDPHKPSNSAPDPPSTPSKTEDYEANPKNEGGLPVYARAGTLRFGRIVGHHVLQFHRPRNG